MGHNELSFEDTLRELAKAAAKGETLNLVDYYPLLEWANTYTLVPVGSDVVSSTVGFEIGGVHYALLFMSKAVADDVAARCKDAYAAPISARQALTRITPGWGIIVDWDTDAELRIEPNHVIEFNERFRLWPVKEEATEAWLVEINRLLEHEGVAVDGRARRAMDRWAELNSFPVLPGSRRARRIEHFFAVFENGDPAKRKIRSRERWREQYAADPYLHHLDQSDLTRRLRTILINQLFLDRGVFPHELTQEEWDELLAHVEFEYERRGVTLSHVAPSLGIRDAWPNLGRGDEVIVAYKGPAGQLFRFSKRKYLQDLVDFGNLTIFPASTYADPSLRVAQHDNELSRTVLADGTRAVIEHVGRDGIRRRINATGSVRYTMSSRTNYYVWCTTTAYDPRLYDDFGVDACLIIHDAHSFIERLFKTVKTTLPQWDGADKLVRYFDPLRAHREVLAGFEKDFEYAYQREYRFIWNPPPSAPAGVLPPLTISLGPLRDLCSVISL